MEVAVQGEPQVSELTGLQLLWLALADTVIGVVAAGAYTDYSCGGDRADLWFAVGFGLLAAASVPLFIL